MIKPYLLCACMAVLLVCAAMTAAVAATGAPRAARAVAITTGESPGQPSVAVDPREGFVVTWQQQEGAGHALYFAVLDGEGRERRRGRIASGTNWFVNWADFPSLAVLDNGDWVTHWLERNGENPHGYDIRLVRSRDAGRSWDPPVSPHDDGTPVQHGFVSLVPRGGDRVLAVWLDGRHGVAATGAAGDHSGHEHDDTMSLRTAVLSRNGRVQDALEIDASTCSCCQTDAVRIAGRTIVAYRDRTPEEIRDIAILERDRRGAWTQPQVLHDDGWRIEGCPVNGPAIAEAGGRVLVAWPTAAGGEYETRYIIRDAARLSDPGAGAMRVLAPGSVTRGRLDAAGWGRGFLVTWLGRESGRDGLQLAELDHAGNVRAEQTLAALPLGRISGNPRLASWRDRALVAWVEPGAEGQPARLIAAIVESSKR